MRKGFLCLVFLVLTCSIKAQGIVIIDTTPGTATNDGAVNALEYIGGTTGINSGFGNVIGIGSILAIDSDAAGNVNIGLITAGGSLSDQGVIYLDTRPGGFPSTSVFTDNGDVGRANVSGIGFSNPAGRADINFGFEADYAISIEAAFASIFELVPGGAHNFISSANITPVGTPGAGQFEFNFTLADIGLVPGQAFNYIATYGNALDGGGYFRSDEFHGVAATTVFGGNIGIGPVTLQPTDFNTFISFAPPGVPVPTLSEWGFILLVLLFLTSGTLFIGIRKKTLVLKTTGRKSTNIRMPLRNQLPFDLVVYQKALFFAGVVGALCLVFFQFWFGEITNADWLGMFLAVPIFAYLVHLIALMENNHKSL